MGRNQITWTVLERGCSCQKWKLWRKSLFGSMKKNWDGSTIAVKLLIFELGHFAWPMQLGNLRAKKSMSDFVSFSSRECNKEVTASLVLNEDLEL
jgi:hypothetical protein